VTTRGAANSFNRKPEASAGERPAGDSALASGWRLNEVPNDDFPPQGRLAGIDYGTVRIGVAVSDPERILASPFEIYSRRSPQADAEYFRRLVREERIVGFVVGLPVHGSGEESQKSKEARQFGQWLHETIGVPVRFSDERYTSVQAEQSLREAKLSRQKRKQRLDKIAAQMILAAYLESSSPSKPPGSLTD
jgi:putative Holliday junction resolvase